MRLAVALTTLMALAIGLHAPPCRATTDPHAPPHAKPASDRRGPAAAGRRLPDTLHAPVVPGVRGGHSVRPPPDCRYRRRCVPQAHGQRHRGRRRESLAGHCVNRAHRNLIPIIASPRVAICPATQFSASVRFPVSRKMIVLHRQHGSFKCEAHELRRRGSPQSRQAASSRLYLLRTFSRSVPASESHTSTISGRYSLFQPVPSRQEPHVSASSNERAALHVHEPRKLHGRVTSSAFCFFCAVEISVFFEKAVTVGCVMFILLVARSGPHSARSPHERRKLVSPEDVARRKSASRLFALYLLLCRSVTACAPHMHNFGHYILSCRHRWHSRRAIIAGASMVGMVRRDGAT
jgi:hypothetical protein